MFLPAPHIVPSAANIAIWLSPDDICIIFSVLSILYGVIIADEDAVLFPNSPYSLIPHDHTVPSFFSACIVLDPDDISITSVRFGTCLNSFDGFASIPDVPYPLYPVVHTVPSFFSIAVYWYPAVMSITFSMFTFVGSVLFVVSPNPSCPFPLYP